MKATTKQIKAMLKTIKEWQLEVHPRFWEYNPNQLKEIFNGVGPESWSEGMREALDVALYHFLPVVLAHDFDFALLTKTEANFISANNRLYQNCLTVSKMEFPRWWQWGQRQWHFWLSKVIYWGVSSSGGRDAFFNN